MPDQIDASRPASREAERRHLEMVAARLFAERGYAATTVDDIVEGAGISKPAMYRHVASKKELYLDLLRRHREGLADAALAEVTGRASADEVIGPMLEAWFRYIEEHPHTSRLLFREEAGDPDIEAAHAEVHRAQVAADIGLLRTVRPALPEEQLEPLGEVVRASLAGLALWWLDHPGTPREVLVATMRRVVEGLVRPGP